MKNTYLFVLFFCCFLGSSLAYASAEDQSITRVLSNLAEKEPEFITKPRIKEEMVAPLPAKKGALNFLLKALIIVGNTLYSERELFPLYASYINQKVSFADLENITAKITNKYRKAGYVLSYAMLPKQEIEKGIVLIKVVEGYISQYVLDDPRKICEGLIKYHLDQILLSRPLHRDVLEYHLLLIRRLGVTIETTFASSTQALNVTDLVVKLRAQKVNATVMVNNDQTNAIGPWIGVAQARVNNITNHHDYLEATGATTQNRTDFKGAFVKYETPVGDAGETLKIQGNKSRANPSGDLTLQHLVSNENAGKIVVRKPLLLARDQFFSVQAGVGTQNVKSVSATGASRYTDKTRTLLFGMRYELSDDFLGSNLLDAEASYGIKGLGSTAAPSALRSRLRGSGNFTRLTFSANRLQQLSFIMHDLALLLEIQGQYAGNTLLTGQRFGVGGASNRAYAPGALTGDSGLQGKAELQYRIPFESFVRDIVFFAFYSYGRIWNHVPSAEEQFSAHVHGVGGGTRLALGKKGGCYVAYGRPLNHKVVGISAKDKVYVGLHYSL